MILTLKCRVFQTRSDMTKNHLKLIMLLNIFLETFILGALVTFFNWFLYYIHKNEGAITISVSVIVVLFLIHVGPLSYQTRI